MTCRIPLLSAALRTRFHAGLLAAATLALAATPSMLAQTGAEPSANALAAAPEASYHGTVVEEIIAQVNDRAINTSDYQRALEQLESAAKQRNWSEEELDQQKRDLLRDLIDNQLLLSKGHQLGITGEIETEHELDELRKQNHLPSMEALQKAAAAQGVNYADFKASIQNRIISSQVIRDEVGRHINITQAEEQQYYDTHKDQFTTPESVDLSEILVPTADPDNAAQVASAQKKADAVEAELKDGKDFTALAKSDSSGSTAAQGGELGDFKRGQLAKVLEQDTFDLKPGQYTEPVRTRQGFVILKVNSHTAAGLQPFDQVQNQVMDAIGEQMMQPALRQYLTTLREQAYIDIRPGYVDAGASPDETRPRYSAYTPPQKKHKKKMQRTRFGGRGRNRSNMRMARNERSGKPSETQVAASTTKAASSTKVEKAGKREKVRFGQAPRETLPAMAATNEDAGASQAHGNSSDAEAAATQQPNAPGALQYENGQSATQQETAPPERKTRYSQVAEKQKKAAARAAKVDQFPVPPPTTQETATTRVQSQPLGLAGDTLKKKKKPKVKPTGKTRYSTEAGKKEPAAAPGQGTTLEPQQEGSPAQSPGTTPPVPAQTTPTGAGDPMGNPTPAQQPQ